MVAVARRSRFSTAHLVALLIAVLAIETVAVVLAAPAAARPGLLAAALAVDAVLLAALALHLARPGRAQLGALFRAGVLGVVVFAVVTRILGIPVPDLILPLAIAAEVVIAALLVRGVWRARKAKGALWAAVDALPPPLDRFFRFELTLLSAAFGLRRDAPPVPSAVVFPSMAGSQSGWFIPVVVIASVMELGAVHALVAGLTEAGLGVHLAILGVHLYGVLWLVGDLRAMQATSHRLEADALVLHLGERFHARIPYGQIQRLLPLRNDAERASVQPRTGRRRNPRVTPLDPPTVHLCLLAPVAYRSFFGRARQAEHLDIFVDRPEAFLRALEARLPSSA